MQTETLLSMMLGALPRPRVSVPNDTARFRVLNPVARLDGGPAISAAIPMALSLLNRFARPPVVAVAIALGAVLPAQAEEALATKLSSIAETYILGVTGFTSPTLSSGWQYEGEADHAGKVALAVIETVLAQPLEKASNSRVSQQSERHTRQGPR